MFLFLHSIEQHIYFLGRIRREGQQGSAVKFGSVVVYAVMCMYVPSNDHTLDMIAICDASECNIRFLYIRELCFCCC